MSESQELDSEKSAQKPASCVGVRHLQATMLFLAMVLAYAMRVNMSMAIVAMTEGDTATSFKWSMQIQSVILSSFFWGYVVLQIPGGVVAARCGGMPLVAACVALNAALSLLLPLAAQYGGWQLVCACRVLQGLAQGLLYPSLHHLISKWIPLEEKSSLGTFIYAGGQLGTALQLVSSGFIAEAWGWPAIFYVDGTLGAVWTAAYLYLGADSPDKSAMISHEEKVYIQNSLGHVGEQKKLSIPWRSIWTSPPFIALIIVHCGQNWGFWTLMTEMPSYFSQVLSVDLKANGMMSALPYLVMFALSFPLGFMSDYILKKKWLSISATRKLSNTIGHWGPAVALLGVSYSPAGNVPVAVALLCLAVGLNAGQYTGYLLVHIDMAPNFAGTLMGITNCISNGVSILAPIAAGYILADETDPAEWRKVFYLSSFIYLVGNLIFIIFGSSETQSWNEPVKGNSEGEMSSELDTPKKEERIV